MSAAFNDAVRHGLHDQWVARADITAFGDVLHPGVLINGGEVNLDTGAAIRRSLTLNVDPSDEMVPGDASDLLFPVGRELQVYAGFVLPDGTEELVPQGMFRVTKPRVVDDGITTALQLDGYDRSRAVSRARFTQPYVIPEGTLFTQAIKDIILRALPWMDPSTFVFVESAYETVQLIFESSDDPWAVCQTMASSLGCEVFFDQVGIPNLRPEPDATAVPSQWDYSEGEDANITSIGKDLDDDQAYNGVIVTGASATSGLPPVRAEAWDTDVTSPTYYDPLIPEASLYGPVPFFMESQYIQTEAQALDAAQGNLRRVKGVLEQVELSATPNPAHDGGDVVTIKRDSVKVNTINILDGLRLPLDGSTAMSLGTRKQRVGA